MNKSQVLEKLKEVTLKTSRAEINSMNFFEYLKSKVDTKLTNDDYNILVGELEKDHVISVKRINSGEIVAIYWEDYFEEKLKNLYANTKINDVLPFPSTDDFTINIPSTLVQTIDVKTEFLALLKEDIALRAKIVKLDFPELRKNILVFPYMLTTDLISISVNKMKFYLIQENNKEYLKGKLTPLFQATEKNAVIAMLKTIVEKTDEAIDSLKKSTPFTFKFWSMFANTMAKDYGLSKTLNDKDAMYAQSAYLLGFFNVFCKAVYQKEGNIEDSKIQILNSFLKEPYIFTLSDILNFVDADGNSIIKKIGKESFSSLIKEALQEKSDTHLPVIVKIKANDQDYFIHQKVVSKFILDGVSSISNELLEYFISEWKKTLNKYETSPDMLKDADFYKVVMKKITKEQPILLATLNYNLIKVLIKESYTTAKDKVDLERLIDSANNKIKPILDMLRLNRRQIYSHVKLEVPFWKSNDVIKAFILMFMSLIGVRANKKDKYVTKKPSTDFQKVSEKDYDETIEDLKNEMIGKDQDLGKLINDSIKNWNPLIDPIPRENLVEDVNSYIRDYVRKFKRSFVSSPPDKKRIQDIASRIILNEAFDQISNKTALQDYFELYLLKLLSEIKLFK